MTGPDSRSRDVLTVADATAARMVLQPQRRRFLEPFLARPCTPGEAARALGVPVEQVAYRVQAMLRAGLLRPVETRARAGRVPADTAASTHQLGLFLSPLPRPAGPPTSR